MAHSTSATSNIPSADHSSSSMLGQQNDPSTAALNPFVPSDVTELVPSAMSERKPRKYLTLNDSDSDIWDDWNEVRDNRKREQFSSESDSDGESIPAKSPLGRSILSQGRNQSSIVNELGPNLEGTFASRPAQQLAGNRLPSTTKSYKVPQLVTPKSASVSEPTQKASALIACKRCNARHFRCNLAPPICAKCEEAGAECSYVDGGGREDRACKRCKARHFRCDRAAPMCTKCEEDSAECSYSNGSQTEKSLHPMASAAPCATTFALYQRSRNAKATPRKSLRDASSASEYDSSDSGAGTRTEENSDTDDDGAATSVKKKKNSSSVLPFSRAPDSVRNALMEWSRTYDRKRPLPCAVRSRDRKQHMDCSRGGRPVSYFKDAQRLAVKMYRLPESLISGLKDSVIVVNTSESTHAFIIGFKGHANGISQFQIWHGVGADGADGFESSPSVKKYSSTQGRTARPSEGSRQHGSATKNPAAIKTVTPLMTASSTSRENQVRVTETSNGATPPPRNWDHAVEISRQGGCNTGTWTLREESRCRKHLLDLMGNDYWPEWTWFLEASRRLRAEGIKRDANSVKQVWHRKLKSKYDQATQDQNDVENNVFAQDPPDSVASEAQRSPKVPVSRPEVKDSLGERSFVPGAKRRRTEQDHVTKDTADIGEKSSPRGDGRIRDVSRTPLVESINRDLSQAVVSIGDRTPAPSRLSALQYEALASPQVRSCVSKDALNDQQPQRGSRPPASAKLNEHALDNVVCIFQNQRGAPPRVRQFRSCDSTQKLFTQALVGDVFGDEKRPVKTLTISFGSNVTMPTRHSLSLVENDEEDFETLRQMIMDMGWFYESEGIIRGSGTLEVRAMG